MEASFPYAMNSGENKAAFIEYEAHGIGDVRITAWADLSEWFLFAKPPDEEKEDDVPEEFLEDEFAEEAGVSDSSKESKPADTYPHFRFSLGVKLPTGDHEVCDSTDTLLPNRFQPGWGVTVPILGLGYRQAFGNIRVTGTLLYEISGGENSVDYEHGDILRFDSGAYYPLCRELSLVGGLGYSLTWIPREDRSAGVKVPDTNGTFHSVNIIGVIGVYGGLNAALIVKMPFGSNSTGSASDVDFQYTLSFTYRF